MDEDTKCIKKLKTTLTYKNFKLTNIEKHVITEKDFEFEGEIMYFFRIHDSKGNNTTDHCFGSNLSDLKQYLKNVSNNQVDPFYYLH